MAAFRVILDTMDPSKFLENLTANALAAARDAHKHRSSQIKNAKKKALKKQKAGEAKDMGATAASGSAPATLVAVDQPKACAVPSDAPPGTTPVHAGCEPGASHDSTTTIVKNMGDECAPRTASDIKATTSANDFAVSTPEAGQRAHPASRAASAHEHGASAP